MPPWDKYQKPPQAQIPALPGAIPPPPISGVRARERAQQAAMDAERIRLAEEAGARDTSRLSLDALRAELQAKENEREEREAERKEQEFQADKSKLASARTDSLFQARRVLGVLSDIAIDADDGGGFGETGYLGSKLGGFAGTPAFDLREKVGQIDANAAMNALANMRATSPTGGAVGQVTEKEWERLAKSLQAINPDQSHSAFMRNIKEARRAWADVYGKLKLSERLEGLKTPWIEDYKRKNPGKNAEEAWGNFEREQLSKYFTLRGTRTSESKLLPGVTVEEIK